MVNILKKIIPGPCVTIPSSCLTDIQPLLFCCHGLTASFPVPEMEELNLTKSNKGCVLYSQVFIPRKKRWQPISNQVCTTNHSFWAVVLRAASATTTSHKITIAPTTIPNP